MARLVGIDFGEKRFGLALSDPTGLLARPLSVVEGEEELKKTLAKLFVEEDVEGIVLGYPLNKDGTSGPKAKQVDAFKARLEKEYSKPVHLWDERFTTAQALGWLRRSGLSPRERAAKVDKVAAQILLQSFLDRQRAPP